MATIDGSFAKTIKMNYLIKDADHDRLSCLKECALIQERNSSFHMNDVPPTLKMISHRIFRIPSAAAEFVFNTDSYVHRLHSSKTVERDRRGYDERSVVDGFNIRQPADWKAVYTNDENKKSFIQISSTRALELSFYD